MSDDLDFHYKRDQRLSMHSAPKIRKTRQGLFRGNRRSAVLAFNLVLIVVLLVLYGRSIGRAANRIELAGCQLALGAVAEGQDVEAVLKVDATASAPSGQRVYVIFRAGDSDQRLSQVLPAADASITIRGRLIAVGPATELVAEVSIGDKRAVLRRPLDRQ